ncbi:MAG: glycosyltransferase [Thermoleophilia bacterium]|nr:glycosyltransferase [Thermoleophilia bacterium]
MRIAIVSEHASPLAVLGGVEAGGQNVHVAALARELGRRGVAVVVHTRRDDASLPRRVRLAPNVVVDHVDAGPPEPIENPIDNLLPFMDEFAGGLLDAWTEAPPDVVHSHFWMSGRAALAAARPLGLPVVHTFHALGVVKRRHQGPKDTSPPERIGEESAIIRRADVIVAQCSDEIFELARVGADLAKIRVIPSGVDAERFSPHGPALARRPGRHRIVVVSRLVERKGVGNVIKALADVPGAELLVAGGPDRAHLFESREARRLLGLAREAGVEERVELLGRVGCEDVPRLIRSADVVVCVPWYEPFGIVPLEAMASGVPVVAAAVGGLIDTVVDGVTGIHVPPRRPDLIARALRTLLGDPALRARLGAAGVRRVRERFTWTRTADSMLQVYADLAGERRLVAAEEASA